MPLIGVLIVWTPFLLLVLSLIIARLTGCEVNEARANPCRIAGLDIGGLLYRTMVMGWLVLPLLPFMALTLIGGIVAGRAFPPAGPLLRARAADHPCQARSAS